MNKQVKAIMMTLVVILFWSTIASAFKISLRYLPFHQLLLQSTFVACIILFIIITTTGKVGMLKRLNRKDILHSAFMGLLNPFLYYLVLLKAYSLLKAQEAGTLNYIWPVTLVLLSIPLLRQRISWTGMAAILISFSGIVVISTQGNISSLKFSDPLGVGLALCSSVFWSLYWILNMKSRTDEVVKLFLNFLFGFIYLAISVPLLFEMSIPHLYGMAGSIYIGIFEMGLTFVLWLRALKMANHTAALANLIFLSPFLSLIIIRFSVGELILPSTIMGLILITVGIILQQNWGNQRIHPTSPGSGRDE
ncbi:MAG: DMT family transporter [Bacteroidales bacterium]|nr:DMT family transporter [Bacteroidales bacterium]